MTSARGQPLIDLAAAPLASEASAARRNRVWLSLISSPVWENFAAILNLNRNFSNLREKHI